jgi:hypothetical protein
MQSYGNQQPAATFIVLFASSLCDTRPDFMTFSRTLAIVVAKGHKKAQKKASRRGKLYV